MTFISPDNPPDAGSSHRGHPTLPPRPPAYDCSPFFFELCKDAPTTDPVQSGIAQLLRKKPGVDGTSRMDITPMPVTDWLRVDHSFDAMRAERRRVVENYPDLVAQALPFAETAIAELLQTVGNYLARYHNARFEIRGEKLSDLATNEEFDLRFSSSNEALLRLSTLITEDLLILQAPAPGEPYVLAAASTCFPSNWSPVNELGNTPLIFHKDVPGMNAAIGATIANFLARIPPNNPMERSSFLLFNAPNLAYFPELIPQIIARPFNSKDPGSCLTLRSERQTFVKLPQSQAVVFGIRTYTQELSELEPKVAHHLAQLIRALPPRYYQERKGYSDEDVSLLIQFLENK